MFLLGKDLVLIHSMSILPLGYFSENTLDFVQSNRVGLCFGTWRWNSVTWMWNDDLGWFGRGGTISLTFLRRIQTGGILGMGEFTIQREC